MFGRRPDPYQPPPVVPPQETDGVLAAKAAQARSRQGFLDAVDAGMESRTVVSKMNRLLADNHFGPMIQKAMKP